MTVFPVSRVPDSQNRAVITAWPGFFGPGDARGILHPSQFCSDSRVSAPFDASLPLAVSPLARREFHRRGVRRLNGGLLGLRPRLLGFGPPNQPCRVIRRSRHGFYAQADRVHLPLLPWASDPLSGFRRRSPPPLLAPFRPWALCAAASTRLQAIRSRPRRHAYPSTL